MRIYEIMFIVRPEVPEEEIDRIIGQFESVVTSTGGTLQKEGPHRGPGTDNKERYGRTI